MTEPQYMQALAKANCYRLRHAELAKQIRGMEKAEAYETVAQIVEDPETDLHGLTVGRLLSFPRWRGERSAAKLLEALGVPTNKKLGKLTERQRTFIAKSVREGYTVMQRSFRNGFVVR